jgi:archaellum component FlaC
MKEEFSGEIASLKQEIEKSMKEIEKLGGEINRLDAENRTVHYNYDAVLKAAGKEQTSTDVAPVVEEAVEPATTEAVETIATCKPATTETIAENTSEPVAEVTETVVPAKKKNCFVRFFRWATFRKN